MSRASLDAARAARFAQLAWIAVGVYLIALGIAAVFRTQGDFNIYYRAGARVLHGETIYRLDESNHFLYAPIFAIFFAPFAALAMRPAQFSDGYLVSAVSLVALIIGSSRMLFGSRHRLEAALIVVPVILAARFINNNIEHGQINLPTLALAVWAIICARRIARSFRARCWQRDSHQAVRGTGRVVPVAGRKMAASLLFSIVFGIVLSARADSWSSASAWDYRSNAAYLQVVSSMTDRIPRC